SAAICLATSRMDCSFRTRPDRSCGPRAAEVGGGTRRVLPRAVLPLAALLLGCGLRLFLHIDPHPLSPQVWAYLGGGGNSLVVVHRTEAFAADLKWGDEALRLRRTVEEGL